MVKWNNNFTLKINDSSFPFIINNGKSIIKITCKVILTSNNLIIIYINISPLTSYHNRSYTL